MSSLLKFRQPDDAKSKAYPRVRNCPRFWRTSPLCCRKFKLSTPTPTDDIRQAISILELANGRIRLLIRKTKLNEATTRSLLAQSAKDRFAHSEAPREAAHSFGEAI